MKPSARLFTELLPGLLRLSTGALLFAALVAGCYSRNVRTDGTTCTNYKPMCFGGHEV